MYYTGQSDRGVLLFLVGLYYLSINSARTNGLTLCPLVWLPYVPESVEVFQQIQELKEAILKGKVSDCWSTVIIDSNYHWLWI